MSGDLLLLASLAARAAEAALAAALRADPSTSARLLAASATRERTLRIVNTTPLLATASALTMILDRDGVRLRIGDPLPADASLSGPTSALLAVLRDPQSITRRTEVECSGDAAFAEHVLTCLRALRPDPLLPLAELMGAGVPSALHTARTAATGIAAAAVDGLRDFVARMSKPAPAPSETNTEAPGTCRTDDRTGAN